MSVARPGRSADPACIRSAATAAEQVGFASVWVIDAPDPTTSPPATSPPTTSPPDPATPAPEPLDPVAVLAFTAAATDRVRLGATCVVDPRTPPQVVARTLRSAHVLSDGRTSVALEANGATAAILDALDHGPGPEGRGPRTLTFGDDPRLPECVARRAGGWFARPTHVDALAARWSEVTRDARAAGRDPGDLELVVHAEVRILDGPADDARPPYVGSIDQIVADLDRTRRTGAATVVLDPVGTSCLDAALGTCTRVAEAWERVSPPAD